MFILIYRYHILIRVHVLDEKAEAQRGDVSFPASHAFIVAGSEGFITAFSKTSENNYN